jgi:hypothetical protein
MLLVYERIQQQVCEKAKTWPLACYGSPYHAACLIVRSYTLVLLNNGCVGPITGQISPEHYTRTRFFRR